MDEFKIGTIDENAFPNLKNTVSQLQDENIKFVPIVYPFVAITDSEDAFDVDENGG